MSAGRRLRGTSHGEVEVKQSRTLSVAAPEPAMSDAVNQVSGATQTFLIPYAPFPPECGKVRVNPQVVVCDRLALQEVILRPPALAAPAVVGPHATVRPRQPMSALSLARGFVGHGLPGRHRMFVPTSTWRTTGPRPKNAR